MRLAEEQKLQRAILALKAGDRPTAREIFKEALRENPTLEDAWIGLSFCVESTDQKKSCLQRALAINPNHAYARSALARIEQTERLSALSPLPKTQKEPLGRANKSWTVNQIFAAYLAIMLCAACLFGGLMILQNQQKSPEKVMANGRLQFIEFYADW